MCGRYAFDDIEEIFEVRTILEEAAASLGSDKASKIKTGEVFPSETAAVIAQGRGAAAMAWGYPLHSTSRIIINARSETIFEKPMFKKSIAAKKTDVLFHAPGFLNGANRRVQSTSSRYARKGRGFSILQASIAAFIKTAALRKGLLSLQRPPMKK